MEENKQTRTYILDLEGETLLEVPYYEEVNPKSYKIQKQDWKGIESGEWTGEIEVVYQRVASLYSMKHWIDVDAKEYELIFEHLRRIIARPLPGLQAPEVVKPELSHGQDAEAEADKYAADCVGDYSPELQQDFEDVKNHFRAGWVAKEGDTAVFAEWLLKNTDMSTDKRYYVYAGENFWSTTELYNFYLKQKK